MGRPEGEVGREDNAQLSALTPPPPPPLPSLSLPLSRRAVGAGGGADDVAGTDARLPPSLPSPPRLSGTPLTITNVPAGGENRAERSASITAG